MRRSQLQAAWPDWFIELGIDHGLLLEAGDELHSGTLLVPSGDYLVASDCFRNESAPIGFDHALAVNPVAQHLLRYTLRRPMASVLDLCAGTGVHALHASSHAGQVTATDLNPRAAAYCAFNVAFNGRQNLECLCGDGFASVAGRRFDLIVCNPPFVLAPSQDYLYRVTGMELDGFCRRLVREAPEHLNEGGHFQMVCEWPQIRGESWRDRLAAWFRDSGCDAWVLKLNTQRPDTYARVRILESGADGAGVAAELPTWLDYYQRRGVEAVHGGFITLRRRDGRNWLALEETENLGDGPLGEAVMARFRHQDFLEESDDGAMLEAAPRLSPSVALEQRQQLRDGHWVTESLILKLAGGFPRQVAMPADMVEFVTGFDGALTLAQAADQLADSSGVPIETARREVLNLARRLIAVGFLLV